MNTISINKEELFENIAESKKIATQALKQEAIEIIKKRDAYQSLIKKKKEFVQQYIESGYSEEEISCSFEIDNSYSSELRLYIIVATHHTSKKDYIVVGFSFQHYDSKEYIIDQVHLREIYNQLYHPSSDYEKRINALKELIAFIEGRKAYINLSLNENEPASKGNLTKYLDLASSIAPNDLGEHVWKEQQRREQVTQDATLLKNARKALLENKVAEWIEANGSALLKLRYKYQFSYIDLLEKEHGQEIISQNDILKNFSVMDDSDFVEADEDSAPPLECLLELDYLKGNLPSIVEEVYIVQESCFSKYYLVARINIVNDTTIRIFKRF